jgi:drug/metabolite transporter (DMT)-like permease
MSNKAVPSLFAAHLALFSVALFYALNYFIAKRLVFSSLDPFALLALRGIGGIFFFGIIGLGLIREKIARRDWPRLIACGLFGVFINQTFFLWGLSQTVEVNASVIMTLTPVVVVLLAWLLKEEKLNGLKLLGLLLSFAGAALLSLGERKVSLGGDTLLGDAMVMINASSYAIYLVLVKPLGARYNTFTLMGWLFVIGGSLSISVGMPALLQVSWASLPASALWGTLYVIIFVTILAYSLNLWAMKRAPASQVGIYIYLQPALVTIFSAFLISGSVTPLKLVYILLVFVGVFLVTLPLNIGKKEKY